MFDAFKRELGIHGKGGYHRLAGALNRSEVNAWFEVNALKSPPTYAEFLCQVGSGSFFGGALVVFPLRSNNSQSVESELSKLREATTQPIFPFGYDGTTELCYCLEAQSGSDAVYWFSWEEKITRALSLNFYQWIETRPGELFKEQTYAGYKKLTKIDELIAVMEERSAFRVRLIDFNKQLQRPPVEPGDVLPRYNKVRLEVTKVRPVTIPVLTVMIERVGSQLGAMNVEYVTFPVGDIPVNVPMIQECYVFDPFNVPFDHIALKFNPIIDLGSKMRVRFKEISDLLR
jgi:hypothetical protein